MSEIGARVVAERYRLVGELGRGGMGRVWAARDELLGRDVAVKELVLPAGMAPEDVRDLAERTIREARAIARLDHRNVVRIFDVVFTDGRPWIVMELVRSRSLYEVVSTDGPMPPEQVARIGLDVLAALTAAHRAGILHRDVKPANVLLGLDGRVVLTDFGLATAAGDSSMTSTGIVLGSPSYLAPERALDGEIGPAADLWSLGATLYAAVEGKPPYTRSSPMATLAALATEPPTPPEQAGAMGPALAALLEKNPARRADAVTAERLLREAAEEASTAPTRQYAYITPRIQAPAEETRAEVIIPATVPPAKRATRTRLLIAAAAIAILAAIVIAVRPALDSASADEVPTPSASAAAFIDPAPSTSPTTTAPKHSRSPSRQPSHTTTPPVKPLAATAVPTKPATTPTGRQIQNFQSGTCLYAPGTTGELKLWACQPIEPQLFSFAPDGTMRVRGKCVAAESTDDGAHLRLANCDGDASQQFSYNASYDLVSGEADKCVDVPDGGAANGTAAQIWSCTGAGNQKWHY
ncbi:protein kinase [Actinoplanes sp. NPDC051411]|uniref:protein kinase domain-containing protein n=1 Tax=Actinoplanes sp. NPDC051411 TaxID=3155522 RepID=UPI00341B506C